MFLTEKQLVGLKTKTKSGQFLGKIIGLEINGDNLQIEKIIIAQSPLAKKILGDKLIIDRSQVVEVTETEMVVEDAGLTVGVAAKEASLAE
jgi:sporulation protein YlmC with PRC-barrel domain